MPIPLIASILINIAISMVMAAVSFLLSPQPKTAKPEAAKDMDGPTAEAGRPIPVVFGQKMVKGVNILGYWDKSKKTKKLK